MQTNESLEILSDGKMKIHKTFDPTPDMIANKGRKEDVGKGFSKTKELRLAYSVPDWLRGVDPFVDGFCKNPKDKLCKRITLERYPWVKVCSGNTR